MRHPFHSLGVLAPLTQSAPLGRMGRRVACGDIMQFAVHECDNIANLGFMPVLVAILAGVLATMTGVSANCRGHCG